VAAQTPPNRLPFPFNGREFIGIWKSLYFEAGRFQPDPTQSAEWNRGAYLVEGAGHCGACHTPRNYLGAERRDRHLAGGEAESWHAPALNAESPSPMPWTAAQLDTYLRTGIEEVHAIAAGPMGPVARSLATVAPEDTRGIAVYVAALMDRQTAETRKRADDALARGDLSADIRAKLETVLAVRKFAAENERFLASRRIEYRGYMLFSSGLIGFGQLMTIAVIIFGGAAIVQASLDLADLLTYLLFVAILIEPINKLINFGRLYQEGMTGFQRFMEALEIEPDLRDALDAVELPSVRGHVEFRDVSFKYKDDHQHVLKDLSLEIQAGEYVALVGSSGVGKTTLCSLIPRFYDVTGGSILLDGYDVREVSLRSLRRNIGVVQQDIYLFAGTVVENISYGKPNATREEIVAAAKQAHAHDFITALPDGYDTDIGQRGVRLSGGQKQRLSIARVFLKNPPIIILDEATSALDNESERAVQASLERLAENRTTLVIAHRLSTIRNARRIVVLSESGIAEQGTHAELLALNGVYANLYNMQSKI
jgi:ABC-type multidrug transport system fused ATPase/permease subunit